MYAIETFIGRRIAGGYFMGTARFHTEDQAKAEIASLSHAERRVNPEVRMIRRVVRV
jgi:hypothetical protein